jgi:serine phosphatase RsbU (regulator of sigma subunit)
MPTPAHTLQCSEVWGGNDEVERAVSMPGLDAWVLSKPHAGDAAGGDIHYLSSCATGRIGRILIADVAGHGEQVATLALRLRNLMRRYVNYVDQTKLMGEINREFAAVSEAGRFATAIVATFWGPTGEIDLTIAGHPPPIIFRSASSSWQPLSAAQSRPAPAQPAPETDNIPLGILEATTYGREKVRLARNDALLLYTDALIEARSPEGAFLRDAGLLALLNDLSAAANATPPSNGFISALHARLLNFTRSPLDDDATMLLLRPNSIPVPRGSLAMSAATGLRLTRELFASLASRFTRTPTPFAMPEVRKDNILGSMIDRFNHANR